MAKMIALEPYGFILTLPFVEKRIQEQQRYMEETCSDIDLPPSRFKERLDSASAVLIRFIKYKELLTQDNHD